MTFDDENFFERDEDMEFLYNDPYPEVREILATEYAALPPEDIEEIIESLGLYAEDLEGIISGVRTAARLLRPVISGAIRGGSRGGVSGAVSGALQGALGGSRSTPSPARQQQPSPVSPARPASGQTPPLTTTQPVTAILLQLLQAILSPEVIQGFLAMLVNLVDGNEREALARSHIYIGETLVPTSSLPIALIEATERFAAEYSMSMPGQDEGVPRYLLDAEGEYRINEDNPEERIDPANQEHRAKVILSLLNQAATERDTIEDIEEEEEYWIEQNLDMPDTWEEDLLDAWDSIEDYFTEDI